MRASFLMNDFRSVQDWPPRSQERLCVWVAQTSSHMRFPLWHWKNTKHLFFVDLTRTREPDMACCLDLLLPRHSENTCNAWCVISCRRFRDCKCTELQDTPSTCAFSDPICRNLAKHVSHKLRVLSRYRRNSAFPSQQPVIATTS